MSMIFGFRMLSDEDDNFIRDYEIPYDMTLKDFYRFICGDLNYNDKEMSSFFLSNDNWEKLKEFTSEDMGFGNDAEDELAPVAMENVLLGQIIRKQKERLIFVFDMLGDRAFFLELTQSKKREDGYEYPRVVLANGDAPDQYDATKPTNNKSIFQEMMDDFNDFEGDDSYDDA